MRRDVRTGAACFGLALVVGVAIAACGGQAELPRPRPIIIHSGVRISPEPARLDSIRGWLSHQLRRIEEDPAFLIAAEEEADPALPWESMEVVADTARLPVPETVPGAVAPLMVYAHLHLMVKQERIDAWLPEEALTDEWSRERAIVVRMSDAWLFQRSIVSVAPYRPLDELLYAREFGYLDAYLFTARPDAFPEEREAWLEENPGRIEEYRDWFEETFARAPPGMGD